MNRSFVRQSEGAEPRDAAIDDIKKELARQDAELSRAWKTLAAFGGPTLQVPRDQLEAIDQACLVRTTTITHAALRG
jgi:hypothetical protein